MSAAAAADVTDVLNAVVRHDNLTPGRPAAGKSGAQQWGNSRFNQDAWMAGYTPELASAVWIGKAIPGPIRDKHGTAIDGETVPAQLWRDFTRDALSGVPVTPLPAPLHLGVAVAYDVEPPRVESSTAATAEPVSSGSAVEASTKEPVEPSGDPRSRDAKATDTRATPTSDAPGATSPSRQPGVSPSPAPSEPGGFG